MYTKESSKKSFHFSTSHRHSSIRPGMTGARCLFSLLLTHEESRASSRPYIYPHTRPPPKKKLCRESWKLPLFLRALARVGKCNFSLFSLFRARARKKGKEKCLRNATLFSSSRALAGVRVLKLPSFFAAPRRECVCLTFLLSFVRRSIFKNYEYYHGRPDDDTAIITALRLNFFIF